MLTSDDISLRNALGRVIRLSYLLLLLLNCIGFVIIVLNMNFSAPVRTWLVVILALPALFFIFTVYIYECRVAEPLLQRRFYTSTIVSLLFLLMPSFFIVYRYLLPNQISDWTSNIAGLFIIALLGATLGSIFVHPRADNYAFYFMSFIYAIMWDPWGGGPSRSHFSHNVNKKEVMRRRLSYYVEKDALQVFQNTLSCQDMDASAVTRLLLTRNLPKSLKVLDIGGGEGCFTAGVLRNLQDQGYNISELVMSDPVDWEAEYRKALSNIMLPNQISVKRLDFEHLDPNLQFDLVIASHSLYATWDFLNSNGLSANEMVTKLLSLSKPDGLTIVVMASRRGLSYHFKTRAIQSLFGTEIEDTTSESFQRVFTGKIHMQEYVDNLINITELIKDFSDGGQSLYLWLSYFLRYDITKLHRADRASLVNMLLEYVYPLDVFPENGLQQWIEHKKLLLNRESLVLMHKTKIFILHS